MTTNLIIVIVVVIFLIPSIVGSLKNRSAFGLLLLSLVLTPLISLIVALLMSDKNPPAKKASKVCPMCAEDVLEEALVCKHCAFDF